MTTSHCIGVDIGGTKIEAALVTRAAVEGREAVSFVWRERVATPKGDYEGTVHAVGELVRKLERETGVRGSIGIGAPGSVSPSTGLHRNSNSTCINGRNFREDLTRELDREICISNDANCLALSEAIFGAARGARVVFGVILGTGVGGGVVLHGRVWDGANGIGGEWGHSTMPTVEQSILRATRCYCGHVGCREQFLSGPALEARYAQRSGRTLALSEIESAATNGDEHAREVLEVFVEGLSQSLASVCNFLDPEAIVLGGGVSNLGASIDALPARVAQLIFSDSFNTRIVRAELGDSSGVLGAACLRSLRTDRG